MTHYIAAPSKGQVMEFGTAFPNVNFGQHGRYKSSFGVIGKSVHNPASVCVGYNAGNKLLEVADWSTGDSHMAATVGGNRNIVVADKPFALAEDTDCHILGVLEYRQGSQPDLKVNGEKVTGGASRFSSFVSLTGAAEEDPKPRRVSDNTRKEEYDVNRETGHAAYGRYYAHIYRLDPIAGKAYAALSLEHSGHTPATDMVFPPEEADEPAGRYCPSCGYKL